MDAARKYVVSNTLDRVDWNAELLRGDLGDAVLQLKQEPGRGLFVAGTKLALALTELGLIDEYEFVVHPMLAGHGPTLFAGLSKHVDLKLVDRLELGSGRSRCGTSRDGSPCPSDCRGLSGMPAMLDVANKPRDLPAQSGAGTRRMASRSRFAVSGTRSALDDRDARP